MLMPHEVVSSPLLDGIFYFVLFNSRSLCCLGSLLFSKLLVALFFFKIERFYSVSIKYIHNSSTNYRAKYCSFMEFKLLDIYAYMPLI